MTEILVVGDCMLDVYIEGTIPRISPEANVPIFVPSGTERLQAGGAVAVARMCARLGKEKAPQVTLAGVIGSDWAGKRLESELGGIAPLLEYHSCTTTKTRLMTSLGQVVRIDRDVQAWGGYGSPPKDKYNKWLDAVVDAAESASVVLMSDYGKGTLTDAVLAAVIDASDHVIVDPAHGRPWGVYRHCWGLKPNAMEWKEFSDHGFDDCWNPENEGWTVVTNGGCGMEVRTFSGQTSLPARPSHFVDGTGCGDQVLATLGVLLAEGMDILQACRWANVAGGLQCERRGIVPVTRAELEQEMRDVAPEIDSVDGSAHTAADGVHKRSVSRVPRGASSVPQGGSQVGGVAHSRTE